MLEQTLEKCPVCNTKIADIKISNCPQCDSDLEIYRMLVAENLKAGAAQRNTAKLPAAGDILPVGRPSKSYRKIALFALTMVCLGVVATSLYLIMQFQATLLEELKNERTSHQLLEQNRLQANEKLTELLIQKSGDNYQTLVSQFKDLQREHNESVQKLTEKFELLMKENHKSTKTRRP